jgi:hypothetical protein
MIPYCLRYFDVRITENVAHHEDGYPVFLNDRIVVTLFNKSDRLACLSSAGITSWPARPKSESSGRNANWKSILRRFTTLCLSIPLTICALTPSAAQQWKETIGRAFQKARTDNRVDNRECIELADQGLPVLEFSKIFLTDSSQSARLTACKLIFEVSSRSAVMNVRRHGVNLLTHVCIDADVEVTGHAIGFLSQFSSIDFSDSAKNEVKQLIHNRINFRKELIRFAGFLQLQDLIPLIRSYCLADYAPPIRWAALLSLSRMGDNEAMSDVIRRVKRLPLNDDVVYSVFPDLIFTRRHEAIEYLVDILNHNTKDCSAADAEREIPIPCGYRVMEQLASVIEGYPLKVDEYGDLIATDYPAALETVRAWFFNNKEFKIKGNYY